MFKSIGLILGFLIIVFIVLGGSFFWDSFAISPSGKAEAFEMVIEEGTSVNEIGKMLEEKGVITSNLFFKMYVRMNGVQDKLQAGTFELMPGMSFRAIVKELVHAEVEEVQVTIPEGFTKNQIGEVVIEKMPKISDDSWKEVSGSSGKNMISATTILTGIPDGQGLEGYLFPDTYRFRKESDAKTVAETMVITLKRRLAENEIVIPETLIFENGLSLHDVLTLASIVEREVRNEEDMKIVAGIFFTRLQIGMALQADSTVNYVTGKKDPGISLEDTKINSPYNTYQKLGLPPGPISNPGMNAINAVLNPADTDYLYFLTTKDGNVVYSTTFNDHVQNKYRYLK